MKQTKIITKPAEGFRCPDCNRALIADSMSFFCLPCRASVRAVFHIPKEQNLLAETLSLPIEEVAKMIDDETIPVRRWGKGKAVFIHDAVWRRRDRS